MMNEPRFYCISGAFFKGVETSPRARNFNDFSDFF